MAKTAFLFPGQASQYTGMGRDLYENYAVAKAVFEEADQALGFEISKLCFEGPDSELQLTANTQPAILVVSIAAYRTLTSLGITPDFVAGHSLGEYSALVAAAALPLSEAVQIVRKRGQYMQEAVPLGVGAMAAIIGGQREVIEEICSEVAEGQVCSAANINSPSQIVIAGDQAAIERALAEIKTRKAGRGKMLPVSAPFHCALMKPAEERLATDLANAPFHDLKTPLVNNVDARVITTAQEAYEGLIRQVCAPVRWSEVIETMLKEEVGQFIEVGPKNVLAGLMKQIAGTVTMLNVENRATAEQVVGSLSPTVL